MGPLVLLGAVAVGAIALYALSKKPSPGGFGAQGSIQGQLPPIPVPVPQSGGGGGTPTMPPRGLPPTLTVTPGAFPENTVVVSDGQGQQLQIPMQIPQGLNGDAWQVNTQSGIMLRSAPIIDGSTTVGQGNIIGSIPNGEIVKAVGGYQDQNGFKRIQRIDGSSGWGYAQYLKKVGGVSV